MTRADATRFAAVILFLMIGIAIVVAPAAAQETHDGGFPKGRVVSANATIPANSSGTVFTVPNNRVFVLTAFCSTNNNVSLVGSTLGDLPFVNFTSDTHNCVNFAPGWVIPTNEVLTCNNTTAEVRRCGVSGILVKEDD
jgi:hypothetical protein